MTIEPDKFTDEKYATIIAYCILKLIIRRYELWACYQQTVHEESRSKTTKSSFRNFLCNGMTQTTLKEDGREKLLGSYHQCYRLDGRLVALGVLDLMPDYVSSVYLMCGDPWAFLGSITDIYFRYNGDMNDWDFGKISAMHEIAFALKCGYTYYTMGSFNMPPEGPLLFGTDSNPRLLHPQLHKDEIQANIWPNTGAR